MSEKDPTKAKFRPDESALDRELDAALSGMSIDSLYDEAQARTATAQAADVPKGMKRGRIINVNKDEVFVDMGGKSQGVCPLVQFDEEPKVGDEMEFHIERYDKEEGLLILNRKGAIQANATWENLEVGQIVEGTVTGMNKGGLELQIKQMRGFMPSGQVDLYFQKDISIYIGQKLQVEVTQCDREKKNLIVSRRNVLEREKEANKAKMLAEITEGQVRRGTVRSVMDFGAFVDLGGLDGLVHVSELSHRRVKSAAEVVKEGQTVDVKIIKIDRETGKIGLSLKQTGTDPWADAATRYGVGMAVTARVARIEGFGAFLEIEEGVEGLLPVSEISWQRIRHPSDVLKDGDTVKVVVLSMDPVSKRMSFSLKQAGGDPWSDVENKYTAGTTTTGRVTRIADFGAFVELEAGLEGLVHISELSNQRVRTVGDAVKAGQDVKVRILEVDKDKRRISLSIRRADEPAPADIPAAAPAEPAKPKKKRPPLRGGLDL